jgi:outer membrane protein OmpA-like peptidoglycan-associated protein
VTTNLAVQLMAEFDPSALDSVAASLGESPVRTQSALAVAVPALLGGITNTVTSQAQAGLLLGIIKRHRLDHASTDGIGAALAAPDGINTLSASGRPLLDWLLRGRTSAVADWVAGHSGIGKASSLSLMSLVLPLLLRQIGGHMRETGWSAASLLALLAEQRPVVQGAPAGLQLLLGVTVPSRGATAFDAAPAERPAAVRRVVVMHDEDKTSELVASAVPVSRHRAILMWALPLLLLIPVVLYVMGRSSNGRVVAGNMAEVPSPVATAGVASLGAFVERRLPTGTSLRVPADGVESKLIDFIEDESPPEGRETWFTFDRLAFEPDSARLTSSASEQMQNIAEILRAYPAVKVEIAGYTDDTADATHNQQLSQDRANATMQAIVGRGVEPSRLTAEGYGEQDPVADNATAEGRQRNRRVDIRVVEK